MFFPIAGIKLFGNERRMRERGASCAGDTSGCRWRGGFTEGGGGGAGGRGSRVGVDLAPSNPAGSIPRHPMARRAKALPVIRADPSPRDLFLPSRNVCPRFRAPVHAAFSRVPLATVLLVSLREATPGMSARNVSSSRKQA